MIPVRILQHRRFLNPKVLTTLLYPEDNRSLVNRAAAERQDEGSEDSVETAQLKKDPTLPVCSRHHARLSYQMG